MSQPQPPPLHAAAPFTAPFPSPRAPAMAATEADIGTEAEAALLLGPAAPAHLPPHLPPSSSVTLRRLLVAVTLFITAIAMTVPVRPRLILEAAGNATAASYFAGLVDSLQAVLVIFSSPLLGAVSDVVGRKPILALSHVGELGGLLLVARFPASLVMQFPAYIIIALTNSYVTTANTIIADVSMQGEAEDEGGAVSLTANYGYLGAVFGFCFLVGPALGGLVEERFYLASSFHAACVLIVIAMLYVWFFLPETKPPTLPQATTSTVQSETVEPETGQASGNWMSRAATNVAATCRELGFAMRSTQLNPLPRVRRIFLANEALTWLAAGIALSSLAQSGLNSIMFLYVNVRLGWDTKDTGLFLSMVGLSLLISQGVLAPLAVRMLGETATIFFGYSLAAVHYLVYATARSSSAMYAGLFVGMFSFVAEPAMKGLLARQVTKDSQGSLQGSLSALSSVVRPLSPIISTVLFGWGNSIGRPGLPFFVISGISAVSVAILRVAFLKPGLK